MKKLVCTLLIAFSSFGSCWEVDTHAWQIFKAYERSDLNPAGPNGDALVKRLGFNRYDPNAVFRSSERASMNLGPMDRYFDLEGAWDQNVSNPPVPGVAIRFPNAWEYSRFPDVYRLGAPPSALGPYQTCG